MHWGGMGVKMGGGFASGNNARFDLHRRATATSHSGNSIDYYPLLHAVFL